MWNNGILLAGAAMLSLAMSSHLHAQFVDSGTFDGTQTLGIQGGTGEDGGTGGTGENGGTGARGRGGAGGSGGVGSFEATCTSGTIQGGGPGQSGGRGGRGGTGGQGGNGGLGGEGGPGGTANWSFGNGALFVNNGSVLVGGVGGGLGSVGSIGSNGALGEPGISSGRQGGLGGLGGDINGLGGTQGSKGSGEFGGSGGLGGAWGNNGQNGFDAFQFQSDGGGGGGGGGACSPGFFSSDTGNGGTGGSGMGGSGAFGATGTSGSDAPSGSVGVTGGTVFHSTTDSFTNNGVITIGGQGGTGGIGGAGGTGGDGGRAGRGGGGGGAGGGSGTSPLGNHANNGPRGSGGPPGFLGSGGAGGAGGAGGSPGVGGVGAIGIGDGATVVVSPSGIIHVLANGSLINFPGGTLENNGLIDAPFDPDLLSQGTLTGTGRIVGGFTNHGIFAPGSSAGVHTIDGGYFETGTLEIEIGGLIAGAEYDYVDVVAETEPTAWVSMSSVSTLVISFLDGFDPRTLRVGDEFDFIRYAGSRAGTFNSVVQPVDSPAVFEVDYTDDGSVTLRVTEVICPTSSLPVAELIGEEISTKNRFLSFTVGDIGRAQAVRVTFESLPPPHDLWNGAELWVGATSQVTEAGANVPPTKGFPNFTAAALQCAPFHTDWSSLGTIHVFHEGIVPGGTYRVDVIDETCDAGVATNFSAALPMTTSIWGDTVLDLSQTPPLPPEGAVNVVDALGVLGRFSSVPGAIIKARADLEPACLDLKINVADVLSSLAGFVGLDYPFTPTAGDPCNSTCPNVLP